MDNKIKNIILILGLSAVAIMAVGLFLYEYIPSGLTISKANSYETTAETTKVLSDVSDAKDLLSSQSQSTSSESGSTSTVKTNIVLQEYDVSKTDLALYAQSGEYQKGRPDPFAEVKEETSNTVTGNTTSSSTTNSVSSDGTFYNTARQK